MTRPKRPLVFVVPGHTGRHAGATCDRTSEWAYGLRVLAELHDRWRAADSPQWRMHGAIRRLGDTADALEDLAYEADDQGASLYLELHFNAVPAYHADADRRLAVIAKTAAPRTRRIAHALVGEGGRVVPMARSHSGIPFRQLYATRCSAIVYEVGNKTALPTVAEAAEHIHTVLDALVASGDL